MTPTTLPATPQATTLAPAQPNAANPQPAPTDFLLMLGQLVGALFLQRQRLRLRQRPNCEPASTKQRM